MATDSASQTRDTLLQRLATAAQVRAMDHRAIHELGLPGRVLMENAALGVTARVMALLDGTRPAAPVAVCCGGGNNGGDGYAVARQLVDRGVPAVVVARGTPRGEDAAGNAEAWRHFGTVLDWDAADNAACREALARAPLVVDALFGTGLDRPLEGSVVALIQAINAATVPIVAVDLPSGVHTDTGQVLGAAVRATHTVTFQVGKPGLYQHPGAAHAGQVTVAPASIPVHWAPDAEALYRLTPASMAGMLPQRPAAGHKGTFGHLLVLAGSAGMGGAPVMAAQGGLRVGSGLVTLGVPRCLRDAYVATAPELMTLSAETGAATHFDPPQLDTLLPAAEARSAVVLGCGLGRDGDTVTFAREVVVRCTLPLLVDADGLYGLDAALLRTRTAPTVLTPHPGELSRLAGLPMAAIQADRLAVARRLALDWGVVLVLKGAGTVIAAPDGAVFINPTGDEGLASGGTGDVLAGIIGGLLAQGVEATEAACLGAYLHGRARDLQAESLAAPWFAARDVLTGLNGALLELRRH